MIMRIITYDYMFLEFARKLNIYSTVITEINETLKENGQF